MQRNGQPVLQQCADGSTGDDPAEFLDGAQQARGDTGEVGPQITRRQAEDGHPGEAQTNSAGDQAGQKAPAVRAGVCLPVDVRHARGE